MLYTGRRKERPEWISLADTLFDGDRTYLDVRVRMLYGDGSVNGILNQYVVFTEIIDEQIRLHGRTQKAVEETIRLCRQAGALENYLTSHEREVIRIMTTLFSQEYVTKAYGEEKLQEGRAEGRAEGRVKMLYDLVLDQLLSLKDAAARAGKTEKEFEADLQAYAADRA